MKDFHELEIYSPIVGFPNYLVTSHGRVLSLKDSHGKNRILELKQMFSTGGYLRVALYRNGNRYLKPIHRLVAQAFIPNPNNKSCVNHIDENKTNNCVSNLEWVTHKENNNYGTRNERAGKTISKVTSDGRKKGSKHNMARAVIGFKINGCDIKYYKYMSECKKDGYDTSNISKCCRKHKKYHKGYVWYYADEFFNKERNDNK